MPRMEENPYKSPEVRERKFNRRRLAYVALVLLALYVFAYGPFIGLANKWNISGRPATWAWAIEVGGFIYAPLWKLHRDGPEPLGDTMGAYARFWCHVLIDAPPFDK